MRSSTEGSKGASGVLIFVKLAEFDGDGELRAAKKERWNTRPDEPSAIALWKMKDAVNDRPSGSLRIIRRQYGDEVPSNGLLCSTVRISSSSVSRRDEAGGDGCWRLWNVTTCRRFIDGRRP